MGCRDGTNTMKTRRTADSRRTREGDTGLGCVAADAAQDPPGEAPAATSPALSIGTSWDPYEVWLTRVKQPRDRSARQGTAERAEVEPPVPTDLSDTARLRALTLVHTS